MTPKKVGAIVIAVMVALVVWVGASLYWGPQYRVYQQRMAGEASLKRAEVERQVLVAQAQAEADAAKLRALAINEVGAAAKQFPEYRQQEFIGAFAKSLEEGKIQQIVYVPTETCIPIVEKPVDRTR